MHRTTIQDTRRQVVASIGYALRGGQSAAVAETGVALNMQSLELPSSKGFGEEVFVTLCASKSLVDAFFGKEGRCMESSPYFNSLEIALIELEYASADFAHRKASMTESLEFGDLAALLSTLTEAKRAVQVAIGALGRQTQTMCGSASPNAENRKNYPFG